MRLTAMPLGLCCLCVLLVGAQRPLDAGSDQKQQRKPSVELTAVVVAYTPDALRDVFEDGTSASYEGAELKIIAPATYRGRRLVIYQNKPAGPKSPWRAIGATIRFRLNEELLETMNRQIFSGALDGKPSIHKVPTG